MTLFLFSDPDAGIPDPVFYPDALILSRIRKPESGSPAAPRRCLVPFTLDLPLRGIIKPPTCGQTPAWMDYRQYQV